jgi:ketosteroid isomerase-like protein
MQPEEIQKIIHQAADAWIQQDADRFASLFTPNGEFIVPGMRWVGQEAIRQAMVDFAATASAVSISISHILVGSNSFQDSLLQNPSFQDPQTQHALVEWHWEDTEKSTGQRHQADDAIAIDFRNGYISRWREYIDAQSCAAIKTNPDIPSL